MAVAVKNTPETSTSSPFDRVPVVSLVGVVYVLSSFAIVFGLIPFLWTNVLMEIGLNRSPFASGTLLGLLMVAGLSGLVVLGGRLLGPRAPAGVRAGIFTGLVGFLVVVGLTRWVSVWAEHYCYYESMFGSAGRTAGTIITAVCGLGLLFFFLRWFFRPSAEKLLLGFEEQGWFSATSYKKGQGMRVRRGTIVGLMMLFGSGIFTLVDHKTLARGPANLELNIPFTATVTVTNPGDARDLLAKAYPTWAADKDEPLVLDRYALRDVNKEIDPEFYVKINNPGNLIPGKFKDGQIVPKSEYEAEKKKVSDLGEQQMPAAVPPTPAYGTVQFASIRLLPAVQFSVPLLLLALSIWFCWRVVNLPNFADFLIATEAELNKVSWTTRKRLYQDTIVVLITVILMAGYLFLMDQVWGRVLSWKPIGVIVFKPEATDGSKGADQKPW